MFCTKRLFTTHKIAYFGEQFKNKSSIPLLPHSNLETDQAEVWKQERKGGGSDFHLVLKVDAYPPQAVSQTCWALGIEPHQPLCSPLDSVGTIKSEVQWWKVLALWNQNYLSETLRVTSFPWDPGQFSSSIQFSLPWNKRAALLYLTQVLASTLQSEQ